MQAACNLRKSIAEDVRGVGVFDVVLCSGTLPRHLDGGGSDGLADGACDILLEGRVFGDGAFLEGVAALFPIVKVLLGERDAFLFTDIAGQDQEAIVGHVEVILHALHMFYGGVFNGFARADGVFAPGVFVPEEFCGAAPEVPVGVGLGAVVFAEYDFFFALKFFGDEVEAYKHTGAFKSKGDIIEGEATSSDDWETCTFTPIDEIETGGETGV